MDSLKCDECGQVTFAVYQYPNSKEVLCTFCQASRTELQAQMGEQYPETIKVLIDLYAAFLDNWTSYNNDVRDGVAILHEANELGWELDFVRRKFDEDLQEIPGHVIARRM